MTEQYLVMEREEAFLKAEPTFPAKAGTPVWVLGQKTQTEIPRLPGLTVEGGWVWVPKLMESPKFEPTAIQVRTLDPKAKPLYPLVQRSFFLGKKPSLLYVETAYTQGCKPGQLAWLLTYVAPSGGREISIAIGDDRPRQGSVFVQFPGYLRPGIYILYASLYREDGQLWLKDRRIWSVAWWCPGLLSGRPLDSQPRLFYNKL